MNRNSVGNQNPVQISYLMNIYLSKWLIIPLDRKKENKTAERLQIYIHYGYLEHGV